MLEKVNFNNTKWQSLGSKDVSKNGSVKGDISLPGLNSLWAKSMGHPDVCVAVLDGPVDLSHPCFDGAKLTRLETLVPGTAKKEGIASTHGTHVASVIFGQHGSPIPGIVPGCRGLIVPIFSDSYQSLACSQIDLARAITQAVQQGAHVINISGGEFSPSGEAYSLLQNAIRLCADNDVLIIAAAGNEGCDCLHIPAAVPSVLAVGAMDSQGSPLEFSNWGQSYQTQGILASGENIQGAMPGGGIVSRSGTSFATPIVSGVAALLLSIQLKRGDKPEPHAIRDAILKSAHPCNPQEVSDCRRFLVGRINIDGAYSLITKGGNKRVAAQNKNVENVQAQEVANVESEESIVQLSPSGMQTAESMIPNQEVATPDTPIAPVNPNPVTEERKKEMEDLKEMDDQQQEVEDIQPQEVANVDPEESMNISSPPDTQVRPADSQHEATGLMRIPFQEVATPVPAQMAPMPERTMLPQSTMSFTPGEVAPSANGAATPSLVYAIGGLWFDFGTEARLDSIQQSMDPSDWDLQDEPPPVGNPNDPNHLLKHLDKNPWEASAVTWTLSLDATPVYAIQPVGSYTNETYAKLCGFLKDYLEHGVERVSIPGFIGGQTRLFTGQVVPVIVPELRGMTSWNSNKFVKQIHNVDLEKLETDLDEPTKTKIAATKNFLERVYYELRNLGVTPQERALNFSATKAYHLEKVFEATHKEELELQGIGVEQAPRSRPDSDYWDVQLTFFNPKNVTEAARKVYRFTIDVSDVIPVTIGELRSWSTY